MEIPENAALYPSIFPEVHEDASAIVEKSLDNLSGRANLQKYFLKYGGMEISSS